MANEVVKRLVEGGQIETKAVAAVANRVACGCWRN